MTIFVVSAPSGSGKTTISQNLEKMGKWTECISHTTRLPRIGEKVNETYYYIDISEFEKMIINGEFAEDVSYDNHRYGITHEEIERVMSTGKDVFIIAEYGGYKQIKDLYPEAVGIFLYMSKEDCMANMLLRGDNVDKALNRIKTYDNEMKNRNEFDYVIKNIRDKEGELERIILWIIKQYQHNM